MRQDIAGPETESTMPLWEGLEGVVREKAQEFIQQILEEEVTEFVIELEANVTLWLTFPTAHVHVTAAPGATLMCCGSKEMSLVTVTEVVATGTTVTVI